jgi:hypothetical protein
MDTAHASPMGAWLFGMCRYAARAAMFTQRLQSEESLVRLEREKGVRCKKLDALFGLSKERTP